MKKNLLPFLVFLFFLGTKLTYSQDLVINEVLSSNSLVNTDEDGEYQDWVELYNNSANPINLNGYGLTDSSVVPFKWVFPNVTINPGSYLLIYCSDKNRTNPANPLHANFKISAGGEMITLTDAFSVTVDSAPASPMQSDESFGRIPNGTGNFTLIQTPTPNALNENGTPITTLSSPIFSHNSGFYTASFDLTITSNNQDATIIYTLDGSEPDENNLLGTTYTYKNQYPRLPGQAFGTLLNNSYQTAEYSTPITIVDRSTEPNKVSAISTTYDFAPTYFPNGPIFKGTVVRAKAVKAGAISSSIVTRNYFITPSGSSEFSLPIVSISTNEDRFFEYNNGIHVAGKDFDDWRTANPTEVPDYEIGNFARKGSPAERVANLSYFVNGNEVINNNVGVRIRGNYSRVYPSKAFNIYSRSELGNASLNYPLFPDQTDDSYTRISIKSSSGDQYQTLFRDPLNHELIKGMRVVTEAYQPVLTFINGEYWGIQSMREKLDDKFFKREFNIDENDIEVLENDGIVEEGDDDHYLAMIDYVENNSLATDTNFDYIKTQLDPENFQDYFISNIFLQNVDWPGNNIIYWRKNTPTYEPTAPYGHDGRWRWAVHDMDSTFGISGGSNNLNSLEIATAAGGTSWPNPDWSTLLLRKLLENDSFKVDFINRFADMMNSYFHSARVVAKINSMKSVLQPEMSDHIFRWKAPEDFGDWNYFLNREIQFANERPDFQRQHIRTKFGITNDINATIDVSNEAHGYVKMNTIDILSTTPGINPSPYPWTGIYFADVPVKLKAIANVGYVFSHWEGFSNSTDEEITVTTNQSFDITAVFIPEGFAVEVQEPIYFWMMNSALPNDAPIVTINSTFEVIQNATLDYKSCLEGYPFDSLHPNWRKASMERRNSPTDINYIPEANGNIAFASSNMRGIQVKQPFQSNGLENEMHFNFSTTGYKNIVFGFAAKNENAADAIVVDYSIDAGTPNWITTGLVATSLPLTSAYQLFEVDFSSIITANNNPNFKVRLRFTGANMTVDNGDRVTFNNFSVKGVLLPLQYPTPNVFTVGQTITNLVPT
ncbi:MAG TPA: CotH kinase family protein, partial [Flavobacterium sp.]|nr:CotH kinase family protein [Flavobacterium sp.]